MKSGLLALISILPVGASLLAIPALAQDPEPAKPMPPSPYAQSPATRPAPPPQVLRVYALRNAKATEVYKLIERLWSGPTSIRVVPDARTNALIVSAPKEASEQVTDLVKLLDVPDEKPQEQRVEIFALKYVRASDLLQTLQQTLTGDRPHPLNLACDPSTNALLVSGSPADLETTKELISLLDRPTPVEPRLGRKVRIVWLVSDMDLPPPPPDLKDVIDELDSLGVRNLRLVTQNMIQTISGEEFSIQCTPPGFLNCRVRIQGKFEENGAGTPRLRLSLNAVGKVPPKEPPAPPSLSPTPSPTPPPSSGPSELATLMTTVFAPPGHKVVLGVTPIDQYTSVFVIQILPGIEPRK